MKLFIDTKEKVVKVEGRVQIVDLIHQLKLLFPGGKWKEFYLDFEPSLVWCYNPTYPVYTTYDTNIQYLMNQPDKQFYFDVTNTKPSCSI